MPSVPVYEPTARPAPLADTRSGVQVENLAAPVAAATSRIGEALLAHAERMQKEDDTAAVLEALSGASGDLNLALRDPTKGLLNRNLSRASGITKEFGLVAGEVSQKYAATLTNERQKALFSQHWQSKVESGWSAVASHEAGQRRANLTVLVKDNLTTAKQDALDVPLAPLSVPGGLAAFRSSFLAKIDNGSSFLDANPDQAPPEEVDRLKGLYKDEVLTDRIKMFFDRGQYQEAALVLAELSGDFTDQRKVAELSGALAPHVEKIADKRAKAEREALDVRITAKIFSPNDLVRMEAGQEIDEDLAKGENSVLGGERARVLHSTLKSANSEEQVNDDPQLVMALERGIAEGKYPTIKTLEEAVLVRGLKLSTARGLIDKAEKTRELRLDISKLPQYENGKNYITTRIGAATSLIDLLLAGPNAGPQDRDAAEKTRAKLALAYIEYDNELIANREKARTDPTYAPKLAQRILLVHGTPILDDARKLDWSMFVAPESVGKPDWEADLIGKAAEAGKSKKETTRILREAQAYEKLRRHLGQ